MIRRLLALARPTRWRLASAVLFGTLALGSGAGLMATSAWLISRAAQHPPVLTLMVAIVAVRAFGIGRGVFRYAERLTGHDATFRVLADLRARVYERLVSLPALHGGDLLGRLVADVDAVQDLYLRVLLPGAVAVVVGGAAAVLAWVLLPPAGAVLLAGLLVAGVLAPWLSAATARRAERRGTELRGELTTHVVDTLRGAAELVAYGAAPSRLADAARLDRAYTRTAARSAATAGAGAALSTLAGGLAVVGGLYFGVPAVRHGKLDGVFLAVVVLLPLAAFEAVAGLPLAARYLEGVRRSAARVFAVLDREDAVREPASPKALPEAPYVLRVRDLRARWTPGGPYALDGVSLDLTPGRRCAVVGPSGSGKTTLTAVLLRLLDPAGGLVSLNGVDLRDLAGDDVRRVVGLFGQEAHLFDTTIGENVRLARRDATDEEVRDALRRARVLDWVDALPRGLDTHVGEHGAQVSGGQRQRIALARTLLAGFPVLLLDEPAEHLDVATADALTADLLAEGSTSAPGRSALPARRMPALPLGRSPLLTRSASDLLRRPLTPLARRDPAVLLVTHRLAGLETADEIIVLAGGRVADRGTHGQLLDRPGPYRSMWHRERERRAYARAAALDRTPTPTPNPR